MRPTPEQQREAARVILDHMKAELERLDRRAHESDMRDWELFFWFARQDDAATDTAIQASYSPGAYDAAKAIGAHYLREDKPLPSALRKFIADVLEGRERPAPKTNAGIAPRNDSDLRNPILIGAIWLLKQIGIPPTQSITRGHKQPDTPAPDYGCKLVAEAAYSVLRPKGETIKAGTLQALWSGPEGKEHRRWIDTPLTKQTELYHNDKIQACIRALETEK